MKVWIQEKGHKGQEVRRIQETLGNLVVDGDFGNKTEQAVKDYQSVNSLTVDGRSGPQLRASLEIEIYAGIDISHHQGNIDWCALKSTGLAEFCWVKTTEGNNYIDPKVLKNIKDCRNVGIPVGGYHFARPDLHDDPYKEVKNFAKHCPIQKGDLRPVMDFERNGEHDPASLHHWVVEFLKEIEKETGIRPIIYTGGNMVKYGLNKNTSVLDTYTLWHAAYSKKSRELGIKKDRLGSWKEWRVWQWTGYEQLAGVSGDIDRNWLVGGQAGFDEILIK